jgi:dCTP diphosphatase
MNDLIDIEKLKKQLSDFAKVRDWNQYHTPKNLSMALSCEAGELLEIFQWMNDEDAKNAVHSVSIKMKVSHEIADILLYLVYLSDLMQINLSEAIINKISLNESRYPANKVKGSVRKYNEYLSD